MNASQMNLVTDVVLVPQGEKTGSLYELVSKFRRGLIIKPPHQREMVWTRETKEGWINRLRAQLKPVGVILTYQIDNGEPSPIFLNDGYQRVSTTLEYLANPELYGDTPEMAETYTVACEMPQQHRHYVSHDGALFDFQQINLGTSLTPMEFCKGILTNIPNYQVIWEPILDDFHRTMAEQYKKLERDRPSKNREVLHKYLRHNLLMITRFLSKSPQLDLKYGDNIARARISSSDTKNQDMVVEWQLRKVLENTPYEEIKDEINKLKRIIASETSLIEAIWYKQLKNPMGYGISITVYRWLLELSLWKRTTGASTDKWAEFIPDFLKYCNGKSRFQIKNVHGELVPHTLRIGKLSSLLSVCRALDSDFYQPQYPKRKKSPRLKEGYDNSHLLNVSDYGEGETIPEPSILNRARGAKPMTQAEIEFVR